MSNSATPWTAARPTSLSFTISQSFLNSCPLSQWCHPIISSSVFLLLLSIFPNIRVFSNELALCIKWPKYWSFSFRISPSNEYSGIISFRIDLVRYPCSPRNFKSLLQHQSSKASVLWCSVFFRVYTWPVHDPLLSHPYMTTEKNKTKHSFEYTDLCGPSDVFLFNMLSRFVMAFLPRSKYLLISWLQSVYSDFGSQEK